jgi:hypothetical protein
MTKIFKFVKIIYLKKQMNAIIFKVKKNLEKDRKALKSLKSQIKLSKLINF